jgi:hypothetical protein
MSDFEDALQWQAALKWKATHFVTRNIDDFPNHSGIQVTTPADYFVS